MLIYSFPISTTFLENEQSWKLNNQDGGVLVECDLEGLPAIVHNQHDLPFLTMLIEQ